MAGTIYEWFGYRATDQSEVAAKAAKDQYCPFIERDCKKRGKSGVCSILPTQSQEHVAICPVRLYGDRHAFLRWIAADAFSDLAPRLEEDGLPALVPARRQARQEAKNHGAVQIGVFGATPWSGEISLPPAVPGAGAYKVDFTLVAVSPTGDLLRLAPVEVQSIDTTSDTKASMKGLKNGRGIVQSSVGLNWENVNKRILPQLIVKGLMLQAERLCTSGMYFVTPEPVYRRVMLRLGGENRLRRLPKQPGSLTFVRYDYDFTQGAQDGEPVPLKQFKSETVSTSDLSLAFITPENLPAAGAYETSILGKL
ncbi:NotI family restriction endonuclease [Mycobacteroides abscessus]|uniref:NotI family restriction endonuclease n=1 Tax=Mycobacteroides abscessus TaxID=36809 RepID=UPI000929E537|nr:NotI family restriction endonuclease [Mycobacteroides abscessus]SHO97575.1 Restriction endonuclease NotI [Mycobacteroides abscessus subsp. abscessus]SHS29534.1 Restriction endonuclease NotI [Mycobacteroides abscessus subsp. abscessus]SHS69684.1 Restriction endonuclease NotI [Mycobacteroides abscessus subsp. abscessus]SKF26336.1 Restriction endonuclease NotI [Mycobacteroides abscessus subsp. abscessus]SKG09120.1 Restriction endonuclease NotI [Mycobacteroides abscessus subsp. abscessus]